MIEELLQSFIFELLYVKLLLLHSRFKTSSAFVFKALDILNLDVDVCIGHELFLLPKCIVLYLRLVGKKWHVKTYLFTIYIEE